VLVYDRAWEGAGWAQTGHGHGRELGTGTGGTRHGLGTVTGGTGHMHGHGRDWAQTRHGHMRAGHGQIVFERHRYPLVKK